MLKLNLKDKCMVEIFHHGDICWYQNGVCHRYNGPAIEYAYGAKEWWHNGKLHRDDGPAVEYADGAKYWYLNGKLQPHHSKS